MTRRRRHDQGGVAMITVLLIGVVLNLLFIAAVGFAVQSQPLSRRDQDWNAALAAAQAGVDDYTYRLQQNANYRLYSATSPPTPANPAFTGWQAVPGTASEGTFHYTPADQSAVDNSVVLTSTGRIRSVTRTIRVTYKRRNFFDYVYFTNYEAFDPAVTGSDLTTCSKYWYQGKSESSCGRHINFTTGDTINGPLHSNDAFWINGSPDFLGPVTTAWSGTKAGCTPTPTLDYRWFSANGCSDTPDFQSGDPGVAANLDLPDDNKSLQQQTDPTKGNTGCLYTGPTRIVLKATGKMDVTSPFTVAGAGVNCPTGTDVALPANGVVYVRTVPSTQTATCPSGKNPIGYPVAYDDTTYGCRDGDVFVSGTLKGQLTIGTEHDTVIVGDLTYASGTGGSDLLGLIASQFVEIYHPVDGSTNLSDSRNPRVPFTNPVVDAAVLALNDSFIVQNHNDGASLGTIHVLGAIAQQWRGPVGTTGGGGTGYLKDYDYDERLQYDSPPFAFNTLTSAYNPKLWAETKDPAACGSPAVQPCLPP